MATPTPGKHSVQAVATPPVSTPFSASNHPSHPAFSPHGPRSVVPSPQQFKKSPANSNTMFGYTGGSGSGGNGGHPTGSSAGIGYDSPTAAMALGIGMGMEGLAGMDMPTPGTMGLGHLSMTGSSLGGKGDEDEKWRRFGAVKDILKGSKGRLSEAGMERLAQRMGLECMWEPQGSNGTRTLVLAGNAFAIDSVFDNNTVTKATLSFPIAGEMVTRHTEKASEILLRDLQFEGAESPLTKTLDRFATNLERLARLDRLSVVPELNCHEAIAGVFECFERLHKWEVEKIKEGEGNLGKGEEWCVREAMCTKSGKPGMHTRNRLGLSLDYWQEGRKLSERHEEEKKKTWSILIECAAMTPEQMITPVRVSSDWISTEVQKSHPSIEEIVQATESGPVLDWLEPERTLLPPPSPEGDAKPDSAEATDHASTQKYPEVTFVAKFDPPVVVPLSVANQLYLATNSPGPVLGMYPATFDGLAIPKGGPNDKIDHETRQISRTVPVAIIPKWGEKYLRNHEHRLWIEKMDYGWTMTELPFSHPKELVAMLPVLRQYALLSTILDKSFNQKIDTRAETEKTEQKVLHEIGSTKSDFEAFLFAPLDESLRMDITLATKPSPRIQCYFAWKPKTANFCLEIKENGAIEVVDQNLVGKKGLVKDNGTRKGREIVKEDFGAMLETCEDLGAWREFIVRRLGP